MPASQNFNFFTYLGADYSADSPSTGASYTVTDSTDGNDNNTTNVGDTMNLSGFGTVTFLGTTSDGIVVEYSGLKYLLSNTSYAPGHTPTVNTTATYVYCFLEGTKIQTLDGELNIETLKRGDKVVTADGRQAEIRWMGYQTIHNSITASAQHEPVLITANALGNGLPKEDLYLTGSHALFIDGALINASALCNCDTIRFVPLKEMPDEFTYWHIETDAHEAIIANGMSAETFVDAPDRRSFDNYQEYVDFFGAERVIPEMRAPRITDKEKLPEELKKHLGISTKSTDWASLITEQEITLTLLQAI